MDKEKEMQISETEAVLYTIMVEDCNSPHFEDSYRREFVLPEEVKKIIENIIGCYYLPIFAKRIYDYGYRRDYSKVKKAVKEFAEKLKERACAVRNSTFDLRLVVDIAAIDNLIAELYGKKL